MARATKARKGRREVRVKDWKKNGMQDLEGKNTAEGQIWSRATAGQTLVSHGECED